MPSVGQTTDELVIVEWLKKEGDTVALASRSSVFRQTRHRSRSSRSPLGTLLKVLRDAGEHGASGLRPVAYIGAPGEAVRMAAALGLPASRSPSGSARSRSPRLAPRAGPERRSPERVPGRVAALPAARRLASALGIDLTALAGTGQDGVITVRDVEQAAQESSVLATTSSAGQT